MHPDLPEYTLFEVTVGVTPQTFQSIRLYFHRLWQIEEPISLRFQDTHIVTFDDSVVPVNALSQALAKKDFYPDNDHDDHNDQGGPNLPRSRDNRGAGQRRESRSVTFSWKQAILGMLAILLIIPQWRRFFSSSNISHSPPFPVQRPIVELANTVHSMPGTLADIMESLGDYRGNLSSMIAVPERWALACLQKDEEAGMPLFSKNRLNKAVCDAGLKNYARLKESDAPDLVSHLKDLRNAIQDASFHVENVARVVRQNLEPHLGSFLDSCVGNLTVRLHHAKDPSRDTASIYLEALAKEKALYRKYTQAVSVDGNENDEKSHELVSMNIPEALQNLQRSLTNAFLSINKVSGPAFHLSLMLQRFDLTTTTDTPENIRLSCAIGSLRHLRGEIQRRVEELEAFQVLLKRVLSARYGIEGREYDSKVFPEMSLASIDTLDMSSLISIALGITDSETARSHMGGLWRHVGWHNGERDYDLSFPSREKQVDALKFAAGGRFRG